MTNSEKVVGGRFGQGGRLRQVALISFLIMLISHIGECSLECSEYKSAVNSPKNCE